jgi:hypothetical protein
MNTNSPISTDTFATPINTGRVHHGDMLITFEHDRRDDEITITQLRFDRKHNSALELTVLLPIIDSNVIAEWKNMALNLVKTEADADYTMDQQDNY